MLPFPYCHFLCFLFLHHLACDAVNNEYDEEEEMKVVGAGLESINSWQPSKLYILLPTTSTTATTTSTTASSCGPCAVIRAYLLDEGNLKRSQGES